MGLFDKFQKSGIEPAATPSFNCTNEQGAWIGVFTACMQANGISHTFEIQVLGKLLTTKSFFDGHDSNFYFENAFNYHHINGGKALIDSCVPHVAEENKGAVLCLSLELISSDGVIDKNEMEIFEYLATALKVPENTTEKIIEVFMMRNKYNKPYA